MKQIVCFLLLMINAVMITAQIPVTNTGMLNSVSATDTIFITGNFNNNAGAELTNAGNVYLKSDFANNQLSAMSGAGNIILVGNTDQQISGTSDFKNLVVKKTGGSAVLLNNKNVNGILQFLSGNISTGSFYLRIPQTGTVAGAAQNTGWVNGRLQKDIFAGASTVNYETGDAGIYAPVSFAFPAVATGGSLTVNTVQGDHPDLGMSVLVTNKSVNRYWNVVNNATVNNYEATFNFSSSDIDAGANTSMFSAARLDGTWNIMTTSNRNSTNTRVIGYNEFGVFALGESYIVLPVKFIAINASPMNGEIDVNWSVQNQSGTVRYEVERAQDAAGNFVKIGSVATERSLQYKFIDQNPFDGDNFYRIKAVSYTADVFSSIVKADMLAKPSLIIYPNPLSSDSHLYINGLPAGRYVMSIYDLNGRMIRNSVIQHKLNDVYSLAGISGIASGTYHILISGANVNVSTAFIN